MLQQRHQVPQLLIPTLVVLALVLVIQEPGFPKIEGGAAILP